MRTAFLCLALLGCAFATPQGYYHQQYNYSSSSKAFKNNELQRSTDDQGYYRKQGDLEGREKPLIDANSEHSEYLNPKLRNDQYAYGGANSDMHSHGSLNAQNGYGNAYDVNDLMAAENVASSDHIAGSKAYNGVQAGSNSYGASNSFGSSSSYGSSGSYGAVKGYGSGYNNNYRGSYGSDYASSSIQTLVHSLQRDLEQDVQQEIRDHNAYSQSKLDLSELEQRIRDKVNEKLRNELLSRYGQQTIRNGMSYTISSGTAQNAANYEEQEYQNLRRELENSLLNQLRTDYYTRHDTRYEGYGYSTSTTTYRPIYPSLPYSTTPRPVTYYSAPNPERLTTIVSGVQTDLDTKLNEMLNNVYQQYFSSSQTYQLTNTDIVLKNLEEQLRNNVSSLLNNELRKNFGTQIQRDGMMYTVGNAGHTSPNSNYALRDLEDLKAQVERNLITKLNQSFNTYKTRWSQSHSSASSSSNNMIYGNDYGSYGYSTTPRYEYNTPARYAYTTPRYYYSTPAVGGSINQAGVKNYFAQGSSQSSQAGYMSSGSSSSSNSVSMEQLQRQLQSELSRQLQDAVARDSYAQSSSDTYNPQAYQQSLQHLTDELNRNLTRRVQEFSGSASYSASGHFDQAQMQTLQNQLQSQLTRELQQKMQDHFQSSSSYGSMAGSSSHYRPSRGSQSYQQLGQYRSGGAIYNTGEDCDHDETSAYRNYRNKRSYGTYHSHSNVENLDVGQQPEQVDEEIDDSDLTQNFDDLVKLHRPDNPESGNLQHVEPIRWNNPSPSFESSANRRPHQEVGGTSNYGITTQRNDVNTKQQLKNQVKQALTLELEQIVKKYKELQKVSSTVSQLYYQESTKDLNQKIKKKLEEIYGIQNGKSHTTISTNDHEYLDGLKQEIYQDCLKTLQQQLDIDHYQRWQSSSSHSSSISQTHYQQTYNSNSMRQTTPSSANFRPFNEGNQQSQVSGNWDSASLNTRQRRFFEYTKNKLEIELKEYLKHQNVLVYDQINRDLQTNVTNVFKGYSEYFLKDYLGFTELQVTNMQKQLSTDLEEELQIELDNNYPNVQRPKQNNLLEQTDLAGQIPEDDLTQQIENVDSLTSQNIQAQKPIQRPFPVFNNPSYSTHTQQGNQFVRRPQSGQSYTNQQQNLYHNSFTTNDNTHKIEEFKPLPNSQNKPNNEFVGQVIDDDDDTQKIENEFNTKPNTNKPIYSQNQLSNQFVGQVIDEDDDRQKIENEFNIKPNPNKPIYSQNQLSNQFVGQVIDEDDDTQKIENEFNVKPNPNKPIYSQNQLNNEFVGQVIDEDDNTQKLENEFSIKPNTNRPIYSQNQQFSNQFVGQVIDEGDDTQKIENEFNVKPNPNKLYTQNQLSNQFVGQVIDEDDDTQKIENEFNVKPNPNKPIYSQNQLNNEFVGQVIDEDDNTQKLENEFSIKPNTNRPIYSQNQLNNQFAGQVIDDENTQQAEDEIPQKPNINHQIQSQNNQLNNEFDGQIIEEGNTHNELYTKPNQNQHIQSQNKPNNGFVGQTVDDGDEFYSQQNNHRQGYIYNQPNNQFLTPTIDDDDTQKTINEFHSEPNPNKLIHSLNPPITEVVGQVVEDDTTQTGNENYQPSNSNQHIQPHNRPINEFIGQTIDDENNQKIENEPYLNQPSYSQTRPNNEFVGQKVDDDDLLSPIAPIAGIPQSRPQTNQIYNQYQPEPDNKLVQPTSINAKPSEDNVGQTIDNDHTQQIENEYYPGAQNNKPAQNSPIAQSQTTANPVNQNLYGYGRRPVVPQSGPYRNPLTSQNTKPNDDNIGQTIDDDTQQVENEYYPNSQNAPGQNSPLSQTSINQNLYGYRRQPTIPQNSYNSRNPSVSPQFENGPQGTQYSAGNQYSEQSFSTQSQNIDHQQVEDSFLSQPQFQRRKPNTLTHGNSFLEREVDQQRQLNNLPTLNHVIQEQNQRTTEVSNIDHTQERQIPDIPPPSYTRTQYTEAESRQRAEAKADALLELLKRNQQNRQQTLDSQNTQFNSYPSQGYGTYGQGYRSSSRANSYNYRQVVEESPHSTYGSNLNGPELKPNAPTSGLHYGEQQTLHQNVETISDIEPIEPIEELETGHASVIQNVDRPTNYGVKGYGRRLIPTQETPVIQQVSSVVPPSDEPGVTESNREETTPAQTENLPWWKRFGNKVKQGAKNIKEKVVG